MIIGSPDLKANHNITQIFEFIDDVDKYQKLVRLLQREMMDRSKILVFCETKRGCDSVSFFLKSASHYLQLFKEVHTSVLYCLEIVKCAQANQAASN